MGSEFVSPVEAAAQLGVSRRTVFTYMQKGILRKIKHRNLVVIPVADVEELAIELGSNFPPLNKKTMFRLMAQVQKLEMDVAVLKRMNSVTDSPLRPSPEEGIGFFQAAQAALVPGIWKIEEIDLWVSLFDRMDEVFFDALEGSGLVEPWRPFYDLCIAQMKQVSGDPRFQQDLKLQQLHKSLSEGLKTLRRVILVWIEMGKGRTTEETLEKLDVADAIAHRLQAKAGRQTG